VVVCRYCPKEITWTTDPVTGKNYPKNLDGTPHNCRSESKSQAVTKEQPVNTGSCTSPDKPGCEFWNVLGVVESLDAPNRKAVISDEGGVMHPLIWPAGYLDEKFGKLKPGYYRKFSGEAAKPDVVTAIGWMGKDEPEWVKARYKALHPQGGGGGWKGQPRNERAIILQCCMKVAADVWMHTHDPEHYAGEFCKAMPEITAEAIMAAEALCKAGGVQ
jgi:hypothetical protein